MEKLLRVVTNKYVIIITFSDNIILLLFFSWTDPSNIAESR